MSLTLDVSKLEDLKKSLAVLAQKEIQWGIFEEAKYEADARHKHPGNQQVAYIAYLQEWGSIYMQKFIPPRPFFITSIHEYKPAMKLGCENIFRNAIYVRSPSSLVATMEVMGKILQEGLQESILDWSSPPNAPSTIAHKGFDDPLIETGKMHDSIEFKIAPKGSGEIEGPSSDIGE